MLPVEFIEHVSPMMNYGYIQKTWLEKHFKPICKKFRLKMSDLSLILLLHINHEIHTAKDVSKFSDLKRGNISLIVEYLSCRGMIEQKSIEGDRRMKELVLTDKCDELLEEADEVLCFHLKTLFEGISEEDLDNCKKVFMKMYENLLKSGSKVIAEEK